MRTGLSTIAAIACFASGCAQYGRALMEFDSVSGFDQVEDEPTKVEYHERVVRWPWGIRVFEGTGLDSFFAFVFGSNPRLVPVDNPSGFARERMAELVELSGRDLLRHAQTAPRILWVASLDAQVFNRIVAVDAMADELDGLGVDPLEVAATPSEQTSSIAAFEAGLERVRTLGPVDRDASTWNAQARGVYELTLLELSRTPAVRPIDDRRLIRTLERMLRAETEPGLLEATRDALARAIVNGLSEGLRRRLLDKEPEVRSVALVQLYRLGGPPAVPYTLRRMPTVLRPGQRSYDPHPSVRRTWVRLCAQLRGDDVFATYEGGPSPVEYLYDILRFDEDAGLRLIALEALAMCLGRPISFDRSWADEWWRDNSTAATGGHR